MCLCARKRGLVSTITLEGETWYRLLETVGTYAAEKLDDAGERDAVVTRHTYYYRSLVSCASQYLFGPQARGWVAKIDESRPHITLAISESLSRQGGASAVGLVLEIFWFRWMTGRADALLEELSAAAASPTPVRRQRTGGPMLRSHCWRALWRIGLHGIKPPRCWKPWRLSTLMSRASWPAWRSSGSAPR